MENGDYIDEQEDDFYGNEESMDGLDREQEELTEEDLEHETDELSEESEELNIKKDDAQRKMIMLVKHLYDTTPGLAQSK